MSNMVSAIKYGMKMKGAISVVEMIALYKTIADEQDPSVFWRGTALDLGSAYGKSSAIAVRAFCESMSINRPTFIMCEPKFAKEIDAREVWSHVMFSDMSLRTFDMPSTNVIPMFDDIVYAFIDSGDHELPLIDVEILSMMKKMRKGALVFLHDFGNQYIGPEQAYEKYTLPGIGFEPVPIDWELCLDVMRYFGLSEKDNDTWHKYNEHDNPMFMACMRRL